MTRNSLYSSRIPCNIGLVVTLYDTDTMRHHNYNHNSMIKNYQVWYHVCLINAAIYSLVEDILVDSKTSTVTSSKSKVPSVQTPIGVHMCECMWWYACVSICICIVFLRVIHTISCLNEVFLNPRINSLFPYSRYTRHTK